MNKQRVQDWDLLYHSFVKLLDAHVRVYLACTGAGAGLQDMLWSVPGCSSFFAGAEFPYDASATERFLGFRPEQFCSVETAIDMALESYSRACIERGRVTVLRPIGLGLTASVASLRAHRGEHRICAAVATREGVQAVEGVLKKDAGVRARIQDGCIADCVGRSLILRAAKIGEGRSGDACEFGDQVPVEPVDVTEQAREQFLARGFHTADGRRLAATPEVLGDRVLFPGAFNPPHEGHFHIAHKVAQWARVPAVFAVTANAPHKPPVPLAELVERAALLRGYDRMFTEGDSLYLDKARRYPGCAIVLGVDALRRLLDPKWGQAIEPLLREFERLGTRFYVFGRLVGGEWTTLNDVLTNADLHLAPLLVRLCRSISGRWDISSSELRVSGEARHQAEQTLETRTEGG